MRTERLATREKKQGYATERRGQLVRHVEKEEREDFFERDDPDFGTCAGPNIVYDNCAFDSTLRQYPDPTDAPATVGAPTMESSLLLS